MTRSRASAAGVLALVLLVLAFVAWLAVVGINAFYSTDRAALDVEGARDRVESRVDPHRPASDMDDVDLFAEGFDPAYTTSGGVDSEQYDAYLLLGSDARAGEEVARADVIMLALLPADGSKPILTSLPRDLWLDNPCLGRKSRLNAALNGCGSEASGPELVAMMVQDFTGISPDHFAKFRFDGFIQVIDAVGGVRLCIERPLRATTSSASLELPAGCSMVAGDEALSYVRSRSAQEYVNESWRTKAGESDLARNRRQQEVVVAVSERVRSFESITRLREVTRRVADAATVDEGLGLSKAVRLGWQLRGTGESDVRRIQIPVTDHVTSGGAQVLLPTAAFDSLLVEVQTADQVQ